MEPTDRQLLLSLRQTLAERVIPGTVDFHKARALSMCQIALDELLYRDSMRGKEQETLNDLRSCIRRGNELVDPVARIEAVESLDHEELRGAISALTAQLLGARSHEADSADWLLSAVTAEAMAAQRPVLEFTPSHGALPPLADCVKQREAYFRDRLGGGREFRIDSMTELSGGFSNETLAVSAIKEGTPMKFVVRRARRNGILEPYVASLEEEYPFLEMLHANRFPVPQSLLLEKDARVLGRPFTISAFVEGSNVGTAVRIDRPITDALWQAFAEHLAQLHAVPWQDSVRDLPRKFASSADMTTAESIVNMLERLREYWDVSTLAPSPALEILFDWLVRNKSTVTGRPVITHGDLGFHNMLCEGERISTFLDWETVMICSPIKDLQNMRDTVVPQGVWPRFIDWYCEAGGVRPDPEHFHYYRLLRLFQSITCTGIALEKMFVWADPLNIDFLELGIPARALFYRRAHETLTTLLQNEIR